MLSDAEKKGVVKNLRKVGHDCAQEVRTEHTGEIDIPHQGDRTSCEMFRLRLREINESEGDTVEMY